MDGVGWEHEADVDSVCGCLFVVRIAGSAVARHSGGGIEGGRRSGGVYVKEEDCMWIETISRKQIGGFPKDAWATKYDGMG